MKTIFILSLVCILSLFAGPIPHTDNHRLKDTKVEMPIFNSKSNKETLIDSLKRKQYEWQQSSKKMRQKLKALEKIIKQEERKNP